MKLDQIANEVSSLSETHKDHEVRIRALELSYAGLRGGTSMGHYVFLAVWPIVSALITAGLTYVITH